jgi:hypothetical protein
LSFERIPIERRTECLSLKEHIPRHWLQELKHQPVCPSN